MIANASHLRSQTGRIGIAVTAPEAEAEAELLYLTSRSHVLGHQVQIVTLVSRAKATLGFGGRHAL